MPTRSNASSPSCRAVRRAAAAALLPLLFGCTSARPATAPASPVVEPAGPPWEIPAAAIGTQQLFRMSYSGPRGEGSFRLALKLESADRYQASAADPLGRALWSLDVTADRGLFLDHRARAACALDGALSLVGAPLDRIALADLPKLLLGRVPVSPRERDATVPPATGEVDISGSTDEVWKVALDRGKPVRWILFRAGQRAAGWTVEKGESVLSDRKGGRLRWRSSVAEALAGPLAQLKAPADYAKEGCAALRLGERSTRNPTLPDSH
jgi:hypothetical protein